MRKIRIQSFSDVITNSSSELFVVRSNDEAWEEIQKKINDIAEAMEADIDWEYVDDASEEDAKEYRESGYNIDINEGDHFIYVYENGMPWPLMDIISDWFKYNDKIKTLNNDEYPYIERYHLG